MNIIDLYETITYKKGDKDKYNSTYEPYRMKTIVHYKNGLIHRDNDLPAQEFEDGTKCWFRYGKVHRDSVDEHGHQLPAVIYYDFDHAYRKQISINFYINGLLCNKSLDQQGNPLPSIINSYGDIVWYADNDGSSKRPSIIKREEVMGKPIDIITNASKITKYHKDLFNKLKSQYDP